MSARDRKRHRVRLGVSLCVCILTRYISGVPAHQNGCCARQGVRASSGAFKQCVVMWDAYSLIPLRQFHRVGSDDRLTERGTIPLWLLGTIYECTFVYYTHAEPQECVSHSASYSLVTVCRDTESSHKDECDPRLAEALGRHFRSLVWVTYRRGFVRCVCVCVCVCV
jgi:hypothetical protein